MLQSNILKTKKMLGMLGMLFLTFIWFLGFTGPVWAGEEKGTSFGLISGLLLLVLLFSTAGIGFAMLRGKATRRRHHLLAYSTLLLALIHAFYNIFFH